MLCIIRLSDRRSVEICSVFRQNILKEDRRGMANVEAQQTKWEELSISNDFLFGKVMQDAELCKELLQRILPDLDIDHVEYPELQKMITEDIDAKGVRLDVYVNDGKGIVYDIEMQAVTFRCLPRRTRY